MTTVLPVLTQCQVTGAGTSSLRPAFILAEPKLGEEEPSHIAGYVSPVLALLAPLVAEVWEAP